MIVNTNILSLNAQRSLYSTQNTMQKSLEKLSSGYRINKAADDAAGLAITEKMTGQINGLNKAISNASSAISLVQTAEGALSESHSILQRMRELAVQSASDTNTASDRVKLQAEVDQLAGELTRITNTTEFNTQNLLAGGLSDTFHVGANAGQSVSLSIGAMDAFSLGVSTSRAQLGLYGAGATTLAAGSIEASSLGRGLSAQTYKIVVNNTAASTAEIADGITGGVSITAGTYNGDRNENLMIKVDAVAAGDVTAASYSLDGGTTWTGATVAANAFAYKGATFTFGNNAGNAVGQTAQYTLTAANDSIQLQDAAGTNIGAAVTVYNDMSSVTVGDAASSRTMKINSASLGSLTDGTATQVVTMLSSSAATFNTDKTILAQAVTVAGADISTQAAANTAITTINNALESVSAQRSTLGAMQNRLEHTINNLQAASENLTASRSTIKDVDMAQEMSSFTKSQILSQAGVAMLAQANQVPQAVLKLLG
ncbi:flagellin [Dehalobacter restrictus]|uniref:Flagellin n=1 Tax=Dehalobacter restrictus (strain DSM 9455 / PER-K23) TaxID=871738 RepID=A0ABM5P7G4_DEHRP|nr:flagellin [Dehalobacter restrictus]AHF10629.1 flagellin [Dehalobacter restrictus DSM 9455]